MPKYLRISRSRSSAGTLISPHGRREQGSAARCTVLCPCPYRPARTREAPIVALRARAPVAPAGCPQMRHVSLRRAAELPVAAPLQLAWKARAFLARASVLRAASKRQGQAPRAAMRLRVIQIHFTDVFRQSSCSSACSASGLDSKTTVGALATQTHLCGSGAPNRAQRWARCLCAVVRLRDGDLCGQQQRRVELTRAQ